QWKLNNSRIKENQTLLNSLKIEHPKTTYLIELLKQRYSIFQNDNKQQDVMEVDVTLKKPVDLTREKPKALVFTHYRDTARKVVEILTENGIKAARFVGQAKRDTIDERYVYASKRRMEKMKQILSSISVTLNPIQRANVVANPMTPEEVLSFELNRTALDERVDKMLLPPVDVIKKDDSSA